MKKLEGNEGLKAQGSFVYAQQGVAAEQGFGHVSKLWYPKTQSYEEGLQALDEGRAQTEDIVANLSEVTPTVDGQGRFALRINGRDFRPTEHAVAQMGNWAGTGSWYITQLMTNPTNTKGDQLYSRDRGDAETAAQVFKNGFRRNDQAKQFLFRTREDGTLRAMLTTEYARVDNRWLIEAVQKLVPGGRLSHWRGDSDTIWGNVLIPDTIREEKDSDYGGMLSIGNSEIGERRVSSRPSIFRAICMNGCIWGAEQGEGIRLVHRGKIDLNQLFAEIRENIHEQLPLLTTGIDHLLTTRSKVWNGDSVLPLFAEVAIGNKLSKRHATALLEGFNEERRVAPETAKSLFGVVAAVTRAGQKLGNAEWYKLDTLGGTLSDMADDDWASLTKRAKSRKKAEVDAAFLSVAG